MEMKRLEISRLMDEYTDTEFFPEGGSAANPEAVKGWVLANVKAPARKKQRPKKKTLRLAMALAAVLAVLVGAGYPYIQHRLVNGKISFEVTSDGRITSFVHYGPIVDMEDGRLFFIQDDGQRIDITDLVNENIPYIYDGSDPDTEMTYYIIIGGTPECYGYIELINVSVAPSDFSFGPVTAIGEDGIKMTTMYGVAVNNGENGRYSFGGFDILELCGEMKLPWILDGAEKLGITFVNPDYSNAIAVEGQ